MMNESIKNEVSQLKSTLKLEDIENQIGVLLETNQGVFDGNDRIMADLETASDYITELETKIYQTNVTSLDLLKQLKDCESEIDALKTYIIDL